MDIRFDTAAMRAGGQAINDSANAMGTELEALLGQEPQWGEDGISALCQMVYQAIVDVATQSGQGVQETWAGQAERLEAAATMYDETEAEAVEMAQWKA